MNIAIIGYGKMGKTIDALAKTRSINVSQIIDVNNYELIKSLNKEEINAVIEFTQPQTAFNNIEYCIKKGINVVSGTTGWQADKEYFNNICLKNNCAFIHASNFNIGTHLFFMANKWFSQKISSLENHQVSISESHHINKIDKPSGTAITLAENIISTSNKYKDWKLTETNKEISSNCISINSIREGEITGIHKAIYETEFEFIEINHEAKNRNGFALGALLAAEFIYNKKGYFEMQHLINNLLNI